MILLTMLLSFSLVLVSQIPKLEKEIKKWEKRQQRTLLQMETLNIPVITQISQTYVRIYAVKSVKMILKDLECFAGGKIVLKDIGHQIPTITLCV